MTCDPDARLISGPVLAHVRSALMVARDAARYSTAPGVAVRYAEMQAALDSLSADAESASGLPSELDAAKNALKLARNRLQMAAVRSTAAGDGYAYEYSEWADDITAMLTVRLAPCADTYANGDIETPKRVEDATMPEIRQRFAEWGRDAVSEELNRHDAEIKRERDKTSHRATDMAGRHEAHHRSLGSGSVILEGK